jgi:lipoate---protein ligase
VSETGLFEVEWFRSLGHRAVVRRDVAVPTLVLGSTQDAGIVDTESVARAGVRVLRRRSGGGAVLLEPRSAVWVDTWVPRDDPLFEADVGRSPVWIGEWWIAALGVEGFFVHHGRPSASRWSRQLCFAGVGPGEVVRDGRKLVGVAQWRGREGVLSHALAYVAVDWARTAGLLRLGAQARDAARDLAAATVTLADLGVQDAPGFAARLLDRLPDPASWERAAAPG